MASTTTLVILGCTGDLTSRLLLPGLAQLLTAQPERQLTLVGVGIEDWDDQHWRGVIAEAFSSIESSGAVVDAITQHSRFIQADVTKPQDLRRVLDACPSTPALYFALPPHIAAEACAALEETTYPAGITLALEKPFGTDAASAEKLNQQLARLVPEQQIHRVDHFLGRSTVFNLLGLRFANRIFEPVWNAEHIQRVDIVYDEQLGLEGRAGYYDGAGALVDMIQSHLLQVMAILAMEPPATLNEDDLRDGKQITLRATRLWKNDPKVASRRARYTAGTIDGRELPSYVDEGGVKPERNTETLAELTLEIANWRWTGVPFTLRSGKAIGERRREIIITFKPASHIPDGLKGVTEPTVLQIFLAPDEMSLDININGPGDPFQIDRASLSAIFGDGQLLAYREVLGGILDNDPSLSVRGDSAVECWRIVDPALDAWRSGEVPLEEYPAGSEGPADWARV